MYYKRNVYISLNMNIIIDWRKWLAKRRELLKEVVINSWLHEIFGGISFKKTIFLNQP